VDEEMCEQAEASPKVPALNSPSLKKECEKELVSLTQLAHHDALNLGGFLIFSHRMQGSCE